MFIKCSHPYISYTGMGLSNWRFWVHKSFAVSLVSRINIPYRVAQSLAYLAIIYECPKSQLAVNVSLLLCLKISMPRRGAPPPSPTTLSGSGTDRRAQADTDPVLDKRAFELFIESVSEAMCKTSPRPHPLVSRIHPVSHCHGQRHRVLNNFYVWGIFAVKHIDRRLL